jgi:Skp family chaperone for outer membrane proteins
MKLTVVGVWAALLVLVAGAAPASAQQGGGAKVAYVNTQAILKATPGYTSAESTFTKELATYRTEVQKLQATLDSAASDFEQKSVMLSPTQRAAKRKDLQGQQELLEKRTQELQTRAATRERELLDPIQSKVNSVIEPRVGELRHDLRRERAQQRHRHGRQIARSHGQSHPAAQDGHLTP